MVNQYELTSLWTSTLKDGATSDDFTAECTQRLKASYTKFREYAGELTSGIKAAFPDLTIHDASHTDALWETGSLIAGRSYPINPLEAFVFGGAVLLHDAAHCFEAFEGGRDKVRENQLWSDRNIYYLRNGLSEKDAARNADFDLIRHLHADQASTLATRGWGEDPESKFYLIEDRALREAYGEIIGRIAQSHHMDPEDLPHAFNSQINPIAEFPADWVVDPLKIACLLRCADAAHLDSRRAPHFRKLLTPRSHTSSLHWEAQSRLSRIVQDRSDPTGQALLITSSKSFGEQQAPAWWIAYELIETLSRELAAVDDILATWREDGLRFKAKKISGAQRPEQLARHIKTDGWSPTNVQVKVTDIERMITALGGEALYGKGSELRVALSELLQNARDAVYARRCLDQRYDGEVRVKVNHQTDSKTVTIRVADDGVGMSFKTLTGALVDFSNSFWSGPEVHGELPGLLSSGFRPVGKFGVGFFSIFMAADSVTVSSRRFETGLNDANQLRFLNGLSLRPNVIKGAANFHDNHTSTVVEIVVPESHFSSNLEIKIGSFRQDEETIEVTVPIEDYIGYLAPNLGVELVIETESTSKHYARELPTSDAEKIAWLQRVTLSEYMSSDFDSTIKSVAPSLEKVQSVDGRVLGFATLCSFRPEGGLGSELKTIGGIRVNQNSLSRSYFGFFEHEPATAKRDAGDRVANSTDTESWALSQFRRILSEARDLSAQYWAAAAAHSFGADVWDHVLVVVAMPGPSMFQRFMTIAQLIDAARENDIAFARSTLGNFMDMHTGPVRRENAITLTAVSSGLSVSLEDFERDRETLFHRIKSTIEAMDGSFDLTPRDREIGATGKFQWMTFRRTVK